MTTKLFYPVEGQQFNCTVLRIVRGKYGRQPIMEMHGKQWFLPGHTMLLRKIEECGLRKPLSITFIKKGDKLREAEWEVEVL